MGAITTTTFAEPIGYPNQQYIDRENYDGDLWFIKRTSQTQIEVFKSSNNGASWTTANAPLTRANLQEISGMFMDSNGHTHLAYRVYESGEDRVYYRRLPANATSWSTEVLIASGAVVSAGSFLTGVDVAAFKLGVTTYVFVAIGIRNGTNGGMWMRSLSVNSTGGITLNPSLISGTSWWYNGPDGIVHPTMLFEHTGDSKTTGGSPALWIVWGRATIYAARYTWASGPVWVAPSAPQSMVSSLSPSQPSNSATYDAKGSRCIVPFPMSTVVRIVERNVDNTTSVTRDTPVHPQGVVKHCAISISSATANMRVYAVGTTTNKLYYVDYARDSDTWSAWTLVSAADIIGTTFSNYSVRRVNFGNGHYDLVIATGTSPFNLTSTSETAASSPKTPVMSTPENNVAADVAAPLTFSWSFVDDDPSDTQNSYALRRQINGVTTYYNAVGNSWDVTETYNATGTTSVTLPASWGADADASHFYAVRVRDQQSNTSGYSAQTRVVPSAKHNPTITSPTSAPTTAQITVSWTVASQTAYRIVLSRLGVVVRDTGWVTSTETSVTLPDTLLAVAYDLSVTTRNSEGLTSNTATLAFTPNYTPPATPTLAVLGLPVLGVIRETITNPDPVQPQPLVLSNDIYRRPVGDTSAGVKVRSITGSVPVNLVAGSNPGFEGTTSSASWGTANATVSTAARDTTQFRTGVASFAQTAANGTGFAGINFGPLNAFPAVPGDTFTLSFWFKANAGVQVRGQVGYRTAANTSNGSPSQGSLVTATGAWQQYTMTTTAAPANTAFAFPSLASSPTANTIGDKMYVDDVVYHKVGATATPVTYNDFTAASGVNYEYSVVTTGINGAVTQSAWVS